MQKSTVAGVAVLLLGIYLLTFSGHFHGIDELAAHATIESIAREGNLSVEQFAWAQNWTPTHVAAGRDGQIFSKRGIGYSLSFLPFWQLGRLLPGIGLVQLTAFSSVLATVAAAILLMHVAIMLGASQRRAAGIGIVFGLATPAWVYARFHYSEPFTTLCWVAAFWFVVRGRVRERTDRAAVLSGLVLGAGILIHKINAIALIVLGLWWLWQSMQTRHWWRQPLLFVLGAIPSGLVLAGLNWIRYGTLLTTGYTSPEERFVFDYANSIPGLLISPGKGIIWFAPAVVLALAGWRGFWRERRSLAVLAAGWVVGALAIYGGWFMWWGGWSWGARYLVPILPFLLIPLVWYPRTRIANSVLAITAGIGVAINLMGVLVDFNAPLVDAAQRGIGDAALIWAWWPAVTHARLLLQGQLDVVWLSSPVDWLMIAVLLGLIVAGILVRSRPALVGICGVFLLLSAGVGLQRHPWNTIDATLADVNATIAREATPADRVLVELVPYYDYFGTIQAWMNRYKAFPPYRTVVRGEALPAGIAPEARDGRLWLVLERTPQGDPASATEARLLDRMAFFDERWIGDFRLVRLVSLPTQNTTAQRATFDNGIELSASLDRRNDIVVVDLEWHPTQPIDVPLKVFVQLVGPNGVAAQHDRVPHNGLLPTTEWEPGTTLRDGYALPYTSGGDVIVGLYSATTGERVPLADGTGDFVRLDTLPAP